MNIPHLQQLLACCLVLGTSPVTLATTTETPITIQTIAPLSAQSAAEQLIQRVIGTRANEFSVEILPQSAEKNHFEIESLNGKIVLRGDTGVSVASALNHYLKYYAHCHLSWCGDQLNLPATLPTVPTKIAISTPHSYRVMFNYCTLNYSCSWWDWQRWERELDFLAMNGINTPLGVIGLEGVWYNTLIREGFSDADAREFLVGPAFGAWQWMTNIERHGGPVSKAWIQQRTQLGQQFYTRARELGMTPIRQGFSGFVPRKLKEKHPEAAIATQGSWCGFPGSSQLDPTDPYFKKIGSSFMAESIKLFGSDQHLWAADPFHEGAPPKPGEPYLNEVGRAIYSLMKEFDPKAIWAMQAWSIRKPITDPVPKGELLVLDLSGKRNGFWGHDYIKGQLHNFGGRINLHGDIATITSNPFAAAAAKDPLCKGMGLFPEAIIQNPVFYDAVYDASWRSQSTDTLKWLADYSHRRYGFQSPQFEAAWKILLEQGPYGREDSANQENSSMIAARPALVTKKSGPNQGFSIPYPQPKLIEAVELLLSQSEKAKSSDAFQFDCVDFTRQVLSNHAQNLHKQIRFAYLKKDRAAFSKLTQRFHELLADTDSLLATRKEFLLGKWLNDARNRATSPEEADLFAKNATQILTLWGPAPLSDPAGKNSQIFDYSWREWSGLIQSYYLPRWQKFHAMLEQSIDKGDYRDPAGRVHGRESLRANPFYSELADWEIQYTQNPPKNLPSAPSGDSIATAQRLINKYKPEILAVAPTLPKLDAELNSLIAALPEGIYKIGEWKRGKLPKDGTTLTFDTSALIKEEGEYEVAFQYQEGGQRLAIEWVALTVNGEEVARDTHPGFTGHQNVKNTYRLPTGGHVFNGTYQIRAQIKPEGGTDSSGIITLTKIK